MNNENRVLFRQGILAFSESPKQEVYLLGVWCNSCGKYAFPPRPICIFCHSKDLKETRLSRVGILQTYTICRVPAPLIEPPFAMGYIALPEGIRVFSQIEGWNEEQPRIGMEMELVVGVVKKDEQGNEIVSYKFRPKG